MTEKQKVLKATHSGDLKIGDIAIRCAVLEDGTRVLAREGLLRAIGRTGNPKKGELFQLPTFLRADNLKPFIEQDLISSSNPILFKPISGGTLSRLSYGYKAEILPLVCNVFLDAADANVLRSTQRHIYQRCKILMRGFAVVGITALVDEATGFQYVRDKLALQEIVNKYLDKNLQPWTKTFDEEFYERLFYLRGWQYKPLSVKRPMLVAQLTIDLVYQRIAPGVLTELRKRAPRDDKGRLKYPMNRYFTPDFGHPKLREHISNVTTLMKASSTWTNFYRLLQRALPKYGDTLEIPFPDDDEEVSGADGGRDGKH